MNIARSGWRGRIARFVDNHPNLATYKRLALKGLWEYCEAVGEVIFEMAFDNMLSADE